MAVHAHEVLVVLQRDEPFRVGAEGAGLVVVLVGLHEEGGVVDHVGDVRHDVLVHFHAHAHFNAALAHGQAVPARQFAHPFRAHAAGGDDHRLAGVFALVGHKAAHRAVLHGKGPHFFTGADVHALVADVRAHGGDMVGQAVAAEVFLLDEQQVDAVLLGLLADGLGRLHVRGVDRAVHAETVEDGLRFVDQRLRLGTGHELGKVGLAQLVDEIELAVRKQAAAAHAGQNVARLALQTLLRLVDGAAALAHVLPALDETGAQAGMLGKVVRGEQPGRAAAHDDDVELIGTL